MEKTIWQCHNPECNAQYSEYVNGCPKCCTGEPGGSHKVSILDEFHPAYKPDRNMEKKYPIGGYAPGNYHCKCCICGGQFAGDKRAVQCEPCAVKDKAAFDTLSPEHQQSLIKRDAAIANIMLSYAGSGEQIIVNQVAGMPLEEAIFQAGYSSGVEAERKRLTPEQMEERRKAIEWYRNPAPVEKMDRQKLMDVIDEVVEKEQCIGSDAITDAIIEAGLLGSLQGAVWVKASERFPVKKIVVAKMVVPNYRTPVIGTASSFNGEMITFDWNVSSITLEAGHENWKSMLWLDEEADEKEVDALGFAEWAAELAFFDNGTRLWELIGEGEAINGQFRFNTKEFFEIYKKDESAAEKEIKP